MAELLTYHESLPDAVNGIFEKFSQTGAGGGGGPTISTSEEWAELLSAISSAGLLPQAQLLEASRDLALPASLVQLQRRLNGAHEPPRAEKIDALLDGSVARVRHLHGLLAQWELSTLSAEQTARLLTMIEALRARVGASVTQLRLWHDGIHASLGPERCQALFWDLLDPAASRSASAHAFQRDYLGDIEKRCANLRVRSAVITAEATLPPRPSTPSSSSLPGGGGGGGAMPPALARFLPDSAAADLASASAAAASAVATAPSALTPSLATRLGGDVAVGVAADMPSLKIRIVRLPHANVSWEQSARVLAAVDASKQLSLSRHAPAFLGHEPCVAASAGNARGLGAYPAHARWHLELVQGAPLQAGLYSGGGLGENSLLFRHWRREIIEGLCDLSRMATFLPTHAITLDHALAADDGCRIVLDHIEWGAEFPEPMDPAAPNPLQQSLAVQANLAKAGAAASFDEATGVWVEEEEPASGGGSMGGGASVGAVPAEHQALRDTLLLYDGVAMLLALLRGPPNPEGDGGGGGGSSSARTVTAGAASDKSAYLAAIVDACAHSTSPPTLQQLLSHPYFAPVEGFDKEDVRTAYRSWRRTG